MNRPAEEMIVTARGGVSKTVTRVERYGWVIKDKPGEFRLLHKRLLKISEEYQRQTFESKVLAMSNTWSWIAAGAIIVGYRDGEYWVVDGQHRVLAANRRADIAELPCLVFGTDTIGQEAQGFLDVNTGRKPVSSLDKFRAQVIAGDPTAIYVESVFKNMKIEPRRGAIKGLEITCLGWVMTRAAESKDDFETTLALAVELCKDSEQGMPEKLLAGLHYIHRQVTAEGGLENKRLRNRIKQLGPITLVNGATKASSYFAHGGAKVWATGMVNEINHGLHTKFELAPSGLHRTPTEKV